MRPQHDTQSTVHVRGRVSADGAMRFGLEWTHLEPFVLQNLLDRDVTIGVIVEQSCLENDTKGTVSDDLAVCIGDFALFSTLAIRGDDLDDLARVVDS